MAKFKFKQVKPELKKDNWIEVEAESIEDAIQDHHGPECYCLFEHSVCSCLHCWVAEEYISERIHIRVYQDEEGREYSSKIYTSGMYRKCNGVKPRSWEPPNVVRQKVAKEINMTVDELLFDNWNNL